MSTVIYHNIVATAGISLFAPYNEYGKIARDKGLLRFGRSNPLPLDGETDAETRLRWASFCQHTDLQPTQTHPHAISAEFSLLHALREQGRLGRNPQVSLIITQTLGGWAAAELLTRLLREAFSAEVQIKTISDLDVNEPATLRRSLGQFMQTVAQELEGKDASFTCFAPVGGYKVMTSLGYLAGAYMGFPTAYLHEEKQVLHEVPAVPIQIDHAELRRITPLVRRARAGILEWNTLSVPEQDAITRHPYLFDRAADLVVLNAFGIFITGRPEYTRLFGTWVYGSEAIEREFRGGAGTFLCGQVRELIKKLRDTLDNPTANGDDLHHELTFASLRDKALVFQLYRGASNGVLVFRAAYRYDSAMDELFLNRIWTNHDVYEREAEQGKGLRTTDEPATWSDLTSLIWEVE